MSIHSILSMLVFNLVSFMLIRELAPQPKLKYISLKSSFLSKLLIPKGRGYVKVADRKKISLYSLIFYILFGALLIVSAALFFIPDIPCEPFIARFGKRGNIRWTVTTLNEKLIVLLPTIYFLVSLITYLLINFFALIKEKTESRKSLLSMAAIILLLIGILVFFIFQLFS